ncbi:His/Glu/Gln/Arg/opine family amino acid ABC transporter permease subunit [Pararhizobium capsulatum DSM 1112]|uniref:His/Glu/Gln/Arg/opine family amino acid ABC transporter permease subunit n=1 Tax=Pararhizobium capsulatum DSM 1112 TaxID=1121113 RepID=A0ABU0C0Z3_9HYPH|nr:amino acid ABC transporter permease [Pararhizobium capsulatum]MDQ0323882.1 His/Glu/Gln/Arg/opine family amino acid ABC transporter permease subunit [Pararhizobium capsulatum DSM 1112]
MSHFQTMFNSFPILLSAAGITVLLAFLAYCASLILGTIVAIARLSEIKTVRFLTILYVDFFRGTPLIVQLFMIYFGIPSFIQEFGLSFRFDRFYAAILALSLYGSAYVAEVLRTGILSLGLGQWDAARALGLRTSLVWLLVVLPQTFRRSIPSLGNEAIGMLKNTSLVSIIGYEELFRRGQLIVAESYQPFEIYTVVALIYLSLTILTSILNRALESRFKTI